jgi:hypothetical protein
LRTAFTWRFLSSGSGKPSSKEKVMKTVLVTTTLVAAFSLVTLTQAQEPSDTLQSIPAPVQQNAQGAASSGDTAYGGVAPGQSRSGRTANWTGGTQSNCSPRPFCNVYSGGQ